MKEEKEKTNISWTVQESDFLQECFIVGIPPFVMQTKLNYRTIASINQKVNNEGLPEVREIHYYTGEKALLPRYEARYLKGEKLTKSGSGKINWTKGALRFMLRAYLVGIPSEVIAESLGVHWKTIIHKTQPYKEYRERFRRKYAGMLYHYFIEQGKSYWND